MSHTTYEGPQLDSKKRLQWQKFRVLDTGEVCLVDAMGDDSAIVQAARVSYGKGTAKVSDDRTLIRYLMRHRHTTPFEMCEVKLRVRVPMDCWRQWIRHRTACLAGDTIVSFDLPKGKTNSGLPRHYPLTVAEIYERFQPTRNKTRPDKQRNQHFKRDRVKSMLLRSYDENTDTIYHTQITDIWQSGIKQIIKVEFPHNKILRASEDHLCLTDNGWLKLKDALSQRAMFLSSNRKITDGSLNQIPDIDETKEEWKPILKYENYEVSSMGRIRSFVSPGGEYNTTTLIVPKIKHPTVDDHGYLVIGLSQAGKTRTYSIHRLVLEAFVGPCPESQEVRHANHNRLDCRLDNLSYGTTQQNSDDRMQSGCNQKLIPTYVSPISWRRDGEEMTYDMSVSGPYHNFYAGGGVVHNSVNEYSTRYSVAIDDSQCTKPNQWRSQAKTNRQGSGDYLEETIGTPLTRAEEEFHKQARQLYDDRLEAGVAREQARKDLPLSTYTEAYWKIDLHNMFHFLALRMDYHAQKEIRDYATTIGIKIIKPLFPIAWEAFEDYRLRAMFLTKLDVGVIQRLIKIPRPNGEPQGYPEPDFLEAQDPSWKDLKRCRERDECFEKLARLGLVDIPIIT
jgi:thymidylate synthase ThyX